MEYGGTVWIYRFEGLQQNVWLGIGSATRTEDKAGGVRWTPPVPYGHRRGARVASPRCPILRDGTRHYTELTPAAGGPKSDKSKPSPRIHSDHPGSTIRRPQNERDSRHAGNCQMTR